MGSLPLDSHGNLVACAGLPDCGRGTTLGRRAGSKYQSCIAGAWDPRRELRPLLLSFYPGIHKTERGLVRRGQYLRSLSQSSTGRTCLCGLPSHPLPVTRQVLKRGHTAFKFLRKQALQRHAHRHLRLTAKPIEHAWGLAIGASVPRRHWYRERSSVETTRAYSCGPAIAGRLPQAHFGNCHSLSDRTPPVPVSCSLTASRRRSRASSFTLRLCRAAPGCNRGLPSLSRFRATDMVAQPVQIHPALGTSSPLRTEGVSRCPLR